MSPSDDKAVTIKRFGLTQVYKPPQGTEATAILVFVHGLFGHPQRTWTGQEGKSNTQGAHRANTTAALYTESGHSSSQISDTPLSNLVTSSEIVGLRDGEVFWPVAILPTVLPDTRNFTWGYDAGVDAFNTSVGHNNVEQHANDLLTDIANLIDKHEHVKFPIIFVVHSLGGIVVKEALNISSQSEIQRLKGVAAATHGVLFLGTPHRGSGSATIGKHAYRISRLATKRPNIKLLRSLEKNSDTLKSISNRFRSTQQKWDIKISSFYEDREVRKYFLFHSLIVDNESAQIGHVGEEVSSIPKNHRDMTKFTSIEEVGFDRVSSQLRRWVKEMQGKFEANGIKTEALEICLSSLENSQTRARYTNVASSYDGTFQWLFDNEIVPFVDWLKENQNGVGPSRPIFWINGKPGSGKSTLMKFAMRDQRTQDYLRAIPGPIEKSQRTSTPVWTFDSLCQAWLAITEQRKVPLRMCIFLDALDEHEGDNTQLAAFIHKLLAGADEQTVRIKICVASRTWNIFGQHFRTCPQFAIHQYTASDIQAYTTKRLLGPLGGVGEDNDSTLSSKLAQLADHVTAKAHGVFIWVRIVVDELVKGVRDGTALSILEGKVSDMPEELEDLYRHTLERIEPEYTDEAYIMLQIALCSLSPLSLQTFIRCTSIIKLGDCYDSSEAEMLRQLISRSGGLLEIIEIDSEDLTTKTPYGNEPFTSSQDSFDNPGPVISSPDLITEQSGRTVVAVQFVHQTVKDFVAKNDHNLGLRPGGSDFVCESGYFYLLHCAIRYGKSEWAHELSPSILEYAFRVETCTSVDVSQISELFHSMLLLDQEFNIYSLAKWGHLWFPRHLSSMKPLDLVDVFIGFAICADLKALVEYELKCGHWVVSSKDKWLLGDLMRLAATGQRISSSLSSRESLVRHLIKLGWPVYMSVNDSRRDTDDHTLDCTLLARLLRNKPHKHISQDDALSLARILLENGADQEAQAFPDPALQGRKRTVLYSCILHNNVNAVELLLAHEAETLVIDQELMFTVWMREKFEGGNTMSEILVKNGILWNSAKVIWAEPCIPMCILLSGCFASIGSPQLGGNLKPVKKRPPYRENFKRCPRTGLPLPSPRKSKAKKHEDLTIVPATPDSEVDVEFLNMLEASDANHTEQSEYPVATLPDGIERESLIDAFGLETSGGNTTPTEAVPLIPTTRSRIPGILDLSLTNYASDSDLSTWSTELLPQAEESASHVLDLEFPGDEDEFSDGHFLKESESPHSPPLKPTVEDVEDEAFQAPIAYMYSPKKFTGTHTSAEVTFVKESAPTPEPQPNLRRSRRQRVAPKRFADE
ncbi:Protein SERAC1 [Lachnellula arida]|uniref:Protein SERAC1 n=1 Tax=Lachnellula arida TaxID=1316785 RepID=A0A8T9B5N0_9HELO|nr:Protein SERAC1 [Lachnellula arida]